MNGYLTPSRGNLTEYGEADGVKQHAMKINVKEIRKIKACYENKWNTKSFS